MSRSFTIEAVYKGGSKIRFDGGRYISSTPAGAAKKAFSKACQHIGLKGQCALEVHVRETTRGSHQKQFSYKLRRVVDPREVERNGQIVVYRYQTKIKSV